jgi:putative DNA primase/helicase
MDRSSQTQAQSNRKLESGFLLPQHLADLRRSGLSDEQIAACGFHSLQTPASVQKALRWKRYSGELGDCLCIPFVDADGKRINYVRLKPDAPRVGKNGKVVKYESPKGSGNRAYFPPGSLAALKDASVSLVITEGEKKAAAADQAAIPCIGLVGVYGWQMKRIKDADGKATGDRQLIGDLATIPWQSRLVFLCFDSDAATNPHVRWAEWHLAEALARNGATVKVIRLPAGDLGPDGTPAKIGLDDFLVARGPDAFRELMAKAEEPRRPEDAEKPGDDIHLTDTGNACRLAKRHGKDLRFEHSWGKWLVWSETRWAEDRTGEIERRAKETIASLYSWALKRSAKIGPEMTEQGTDATPAERKDELKRITRIMQWCLTSEAAKNINAMIDLARSEPNIPIQASALDRDPFLLNCLNGTLDLRTGTLREYDRADYLTKIITVAYDPQAKCPLWERFLSEIMEDNRDLVDYLQRVIGYAMTGDVSEQCLFFLHGDGQNGKSTFLGVLQEMLASYAMQGVSELLMVRNGEHHPTERADLFGKRFVATIEIEDGKRMAESLMKQLTGEDRIRARRMREDFWEFLPTHKIFLAANHKPVIRGDDFGVWRRIRLIPFNYTVPAEKKDKGLSAKLKAELPGILAWAVRGCLEWQKIGLADPEEVCQATDKYKSEMDTIAQFLEDRCRVHRELKVKVGELFEAFKHWSGDTQTTSRQFNQKIEAKGFSRSDRSTGGYYFWLGIGLV